MSNTLLFKYTMQMYDLKGDAPIFFTPPSFFAQEAIHYKVSKGRSVNSDTCRRHRQGHRQPKNVRTVFLPCLSYPCFSDIPPRWFINRSHPTFTSVLFSPIFTDGNRLRKYRHTPAQQPERANFLIRPDRRQEWRKFVLTATAVSQARE